MIRKIRVEGFKSIASQELELGRVNCFIGANGVGKSNILEAIGVLGAAASGKVDDESLIRRGVRAGLPRLYKTSFEASRTPPHITLSATGAHREEFRVGLLNPLENPNPAWDFKIEYLSDGARDVVSRGVKTNINLAANAGLSALKAVDLPPGNAAAKLLSSLQGYAIYCPNTPTLRGKPDPQQRTPLGLSGGNLAEAFSTIRKTVLDKNEELFWEILGLVDWVDEIETTDSASALLSPSVPRSKYVLKFTDRYMNRSRNTLTAHDASEGALYVLFCAILCLSPKAPKLFAIDNLDQALNPRLVTRLTGYLASWLRHADPERQLLFTAHNPAVLDGLDLTDDDTRLFAVDRNSHGHTSIARIEMTPELLAQAAEYPLSRLWLMGHLGAVPNV